MQHTLRIFGLIFLYCNCLFSQEQHSNYDIVWNTADDVLPQNSIKSIVKDNYGFIWISSESGLLRFDGKNYLVFDDKKLPGLSSNRMLLFQGSVLNDSIYISNDKYEYLLITKGHPHFVKKIIPKYVGNQDYFSEMSFQKMYSNKGYYHVKQNQILSYSLSDNLLWKVDLETSRYIIFIFEDKLYGWDKLGNTFLFDGGKKKKIIVHGLTDSHFKIEPNIASQQVFYRDQRTLYMMVSIENQLHLKPVLKDYDLSKFHIASVFFDKTTQILYIGSSSKGMLTIKNKDFRVLRGIKNDHDVFYAQIPFGKNAFLSSYGELFSTNGISQKFNFEEPNDGRKLMVDSKGNLYARSFESAFCFYKKTGYKTVKRWDFKNYCVAFLEMKNGVILFALYHERNQKGYLLELNEKGQFVNKMVLNFGPEHIVEKEPEVIWSGSNSGLFKINLRNKKYEKIKAFQNFSIRSIKIEDKNKIWVTTYGNGFFLYDDASKKITQFPLDKNKSLSFSHCIIEDAKGFFWITTNNGLFQVSKESLLNYAKGKSTAVFYYYYDKSNGFASNEFNGGCTPCGNLLNRDSITFPSMEGIVLFNPNKTNPILPKSKIFFEEAEIDNITYPQHSDTLHLNPDFKRLRLFIRSPYYGHPNNLKIDVKVDGPISQDWSPLQEDNITFTSLPSGNYIITARKLSGFDSKYTYSQKVLIVPKKFYQTTFFKLFLSFIAIGIGYAIFRARAKSLEKRNFILEKKVEERSIELYKSISKLQETRTQLKTEVINHKKLIATITHDIRSPLRFISLTGKNVYESITEETADNEDKLALKEEAKAVYTSTFQLYNFVENLLEYAKISSQENASDFHELHGLVQKKIMMFVNIAESKKIEIKNSVEENVLIYTNKLLLSIILHNILDNAIKNTYSGEISFDAQFDAAITRIKITDTGSGMTKDTVDFYTQLFAKKETDKNNIKIGMGFQMISELLLLLGGEIEISSVLNSGTTICLLLPNNKPIKHL